MNDELKNPYPEEFGYYRIGTPINADLCKAKPDCPAFDMGRLQTTGCLDWSANPITAKTIQAGGSDQRSQDASGYSVDASCSIDTPWVDAAMSFHANQSKNHCEKHSAQTITAVARQETSLRLRANLSPDTLRTCATPDFEEHIAAIIRAADRLDGDSALVSSTTDDHSAAGKAKQIDRDHAATALNDALLAFYERYGTGFISKLLLGSIGVFQATAQYDSSADDEHANFGGSFSVSGFFGGVSAAAEYTKHHMLTNATGTVVCKTFCMPTNSNAATWVDGLLNAFDGQQLAKLGNLEAWKAPFEVAVAHAQPPKIKARKPLEVLSEFKGTTIEEKLQHLELRRLESEYEKTKGKKPSADEYYKWLADLKKIARNVDDVRSFAKVKSDQPKTVAAHAPVSLLTFAATGSPNKLIADTPMERFRSTRLGAMLETGEAAVPPKRLSTSNRLPSTPPSGDDVDFGEYGVVGYEYTPWEQVFPALKTYFAPEISPSKLILAFAMAWLSSRQLLQQYLAFCARWFPTIAPQGCKAAANAFKEALAIVSADLASNGATSPNEVPERLEAQFREALRRCRFSMMSHYDFLIDHYGWLRRLPFGAVPLVADHPNHPRGYYFAPYSFEMKNNLPQYASGRIQATDAPAPVLLESNALRLYPIVCTALDGRPSFFWANRQQAFTVGKDGEQVVRMPGATLCRTIPVPPLANLQTWGMCNTFNGASIEEMFASRFNGLDVAGCQASVIDQLAVPDESTIGDAVWKVTKQGVSHPALFGAHLLYLSNTKLIPASVIPDSDRMMRILEGKDQEFEYSPMKQRGVVQGPFIAIGVLTDQDLEHPIRGLLHDVCLAPVDYADARLVGAFKGGGPMWTEPRTERLLEIVRAWAEQADAPIPTQIDSRWPVMDIAEVRRPMEREKQTELAEHT